MSKYKYGIASLVISDIDAATGLAAAGTDYDLKEDVFRDTFTLTEEEGTTTDYFSEMDTTPKISFTESGRETITLSLMNTNIDNIVRFLGGAKVTADGKDTWSKPTNQGDIYKHIVLTTEDGTVLTIYKGKVSARKNFQFRRNNIWLLDVTITPLTPDVAGLAAMDISQPTPAP